MIFQLDVMHNLPTKLIHKFLYAKLPLVSIKAYSKSSECHKMAPLVLLDYIIMTLDLFLLQASKENEVVLISHNLGPLHIWEHIQLTSNLG
jgi:hypothetical protein